MACCEHHRQQSDAFRYAYLHSIPSSASGRRAAAAAAVPSPCSGADVEVAKTAAVMMSGSVIDPVTMQQHFATTTTSSITTRPPYSYVALIAMAIASSSDGRMTLAEIYRYISEQFPYFRRDADPATLDGCDARRWQNSVRHNLSLNDCFVRVERSKTDRTDGKGGYWTLHPLCRSMFVDGSLLRRARRFRAPPPSRPLSADVHQRWRHLNHATSNSNRLRLPSSDKYVDYCIGGYHPTAYANLESAFETTRMPVGQFLCRRWWQNCVETVDSQLPASAISRCGCCVQQSSNLPTINLF